MEETEICLGLKNGLRTVANGAGSALSINFITAWKYFEHERFSVQSKY